MSKGKEKNPFKFQGFTERIASIKLDVAHRVEKRVSEPEETETFCNEALNKWQELNCTEHFQAFTKELRPLVQTLAQLIHHERSVIAILQKHLLIQDTLALEPLFDVVVQLARDLQCDFYPHFKDFFHVFIKLLGRNALNSEALEQIFTVIGYLFKFLWKYMVKDIENVFRLYSPLLNHEQKPYIRQFSAESFAFLMRKVKDQSSLLNMLFASLEENPDMVEGIGFLLFEIVKGVRKQFHSQTEKLLKLMLSKLGPVIDDRNVVALAPQLPWQLVFESLSYSLHLMAKYTSSEHSFVVVDCLTHHLMSLFLQSQKILRKYEPDAHTALLINLSYALQLTNNWVSWKNGSLVVQPMTLHDVVRSLLRSQEVAQQLADPLLDLVSSMLKANFSSLRVDIHSRDLIKSIFDSNLGKPIEFPLKSLFTFAKSLLKWNYFHHEILPYTLSTCQANLHEGVSQEVKKDVVLMLVELVLSGIVNDEYGADVKSKQGLVYLPKCGTRTGGHILDCLLDCVVVGSETDFALAWGVLVVLPCIRPLNGPKCSKRLKEFITNSISFISSQEELKQEHWLYVLSQAILSHFYINRQCKTPDSTLDIDFIVQLLSKFQDNFHILHACASVLSQINTKKNEELLSPDNLQSVYPLLKDNLTNPAHLVRLKTLQILNEFQQLEFLPTEENPNPGQCNIFQLCLDAEAALPTFQQYRHKDILLRKLTYSKPYYTSLPEFYWDVPVRFLIGQLYINFKPIWTPAMEILKSLTNRDFMKTFWAVYSNHLKTAANNAEKELSLEASSKTAIYKSYEEGKADNIEQVFTSLFGIGVGPREDNRTDHTNFRQLMWKTMAQFPDVVELKSRDLVPLLLKFMSNEYERSDDHSAPSQDIRNKELTNDDTTTAMDQSDLLIDSIASPKETRDSNHPGRRKAATKSLCVHLELFSLFHNPKALSKELQVKEIYLTMLGHRDGEVQKLAVKCIQTYKFPYTMPYQENLDRLLEDENFKDELTNLMVKEGEATIDPVHREGLMPIIIRLLYGKMQRWTGAGSSGKAGVGARRSTILRFLGNCSHGEMKVFMDLILAPFNHLYCDEHVIQTPRDLSSVVPIKKQIGFLNMMQQILNKLGAEADAFLPSLLQICLSLLSTCAFSLQHRDEVRASHISQLKQIRQLAICRLIDFFHAKPEYDYTAVIDALFDAAVWPQIENLEKESIQNPSPLLKLLHCWTQNSRFFSLLSRTPDSSPESAIMGHVFSCLCAPNVCQSVLNMVMEMADNLLSAEDIGDQSDAKEDLIVNEQSSTLLSKASYGTRLVLPHLSSILNCLSSTVKTLGKPVKQGTKRTKTALPRLELSVLSRISPYVNNEENSTSLLNLLLPLLYLRPNEETENYILKSVHNLLSNISNPVDFTKQLGRLFSQFNARSSRQLLCEIFQEIARLESTYAPVAGIVTQLNSWDDKKIEEPNYEERIAGFSSTVELISKSSKLGDVADFPPNVEIFDSPPPEDSVPINFILPILHNCLYFVHRSDDMAIRDGAVNCINSLVEGVSSRKNDEEFSELILNCILPSCKLAMKSKKESVRNEFLGILSTLVRQFDHSIFQDMCILVDKDPEIDFFENMRHIQHHRRIRALHRLEILCSKNTFKPSTLVSFLLPIAMAYPSEYTNAKDHNLVTQAISTIGAISASLPWSKYSFLLRTYLRSLQRENEKQKMIVRIIVAILKGFHFDLSSHRFAADGLPQDERKAEINVQRSKTSNSDEMISNSKESDKDHQEDESKDTKVEEDGDDDKNDDEDDDEEDETTEVLNNTIDDALALRIYQAITTKILPQLSKILTKKQQSGYHKLSHMKKVDEQEALRVPIVLAIVKLLQSLPKETLHLHLPGLLLRVCVTLRSRARDVRDTARDVLCQIALSLGTKYFSFIVKEMKTALTRGYQLHVLGFTLHSLLDKMASTLSPGDLDHCIPDISQILVEDLFGEVASEREVDKLANKLHEAKSSKSYDSFEILAKYIGSTSLSLLVTPLQEVLDSNQSHKISQRAAETLRRVSIGLQANTDLPVQTMMVFIHRIVNEKLPVITAKKQVDKEDQADETPTAILTTQDSYLISPTPLRGGKIPGVSSKTNAHVIVEFGLQMLITALKRGKLSAADQSHLQLLDPFVTVLSDCMQTKHTKVLTLSLRSLCFVIKLPLPSLDKKVPNIAKLLFKTLQKYSSVGGKVGENYEMVFSAFKAMTVIIRDFNKYTIAQKHLQVLLGFVEEDIHDHSRQGTAFPLLKAILTRKLIVPEIHDVMKKVSQLAITGATPTVQQQCRQCVIQYMLDYPLGKKLQRLLEFVVSQLSYEHETGRESALEMMMAIFNSFPESLLFDYASFFFVPLTTRLVNDDSAKCRKLTASAIKSLLQKVDVERRDNLFAMIVQWFNNEKVALRRLAVQLCGLFVEAEGKAFDRRLQTTLPLISELIEPQQYETDDEKEEDNNNTTLERAMDHLLFNALTTLAKILQDNQNAWSENYMDCMDSMWESVESHLLHPHAWVRLVSSRLFGLLFSTCKPEDLVRNARSKMPTYLTEDAYGKILKLCDDFCQQLDSQYIQQDLGDQIIKNLVFIAKVLILYGMEDQKTGQDFTLMTLFDKMEKLATREASSAPKKIQKRSCVMRWLAAIAMVLGKDDVMPYLKSILQPIHRELEIQTTYKDPELQNIAQEVLELVKGLVGRESVSRVYASLQSDVTDVKEKRKRKKALEAVADPSQSARKKLKRNLMKKESRKRKIDKFKPERRLKKTRFVETVE